MDKQSLTAERLRELLTYDPETGEFRWREKGQHWRQEAGTVCIRRNGRSARITIQFERQIYYAHRLAWLWMEGEWPKLGIDHINGDSLDNRWSNLRLATDQENKRNHKIYENNKSRYTGVWWWEAQQSYQVKVANRTVGYFKTKEAAHEAYEHAATNAFGEFKRPSEEGVTL